MKIIRKLICYVLGHSLICLHMHQFKSGKYEEYTSTSSGWKCSRCEKTFSEQWDE